MKSYFSNKNVALVFLLVFFLTFSGCSAKTPAQKSLGADADYFIGLKLLEEGKQKEAINKFSHCVKKGTYYCAKESAIKLCGFGSLQEKNEACMRLVEKFPEEDTILIAVRQFVESEEVSKVIEYTSGLNFENASNELIRMRLEALDKRNDSKYQNEVYKWFTSRPLSQEHYQFYRDYYKHPDFEQENVVCTPHQYAINYRIELYKRNYTFTFENSNTLINWMENGSILPNEQLASDLGKSFLYGSMRFANNAQTFKSLAEKFAQTPMAYYFWFYASRLYEKGGVYYSQTKNCFQQAIETATTPDQKDNALWYLLNSSLNTNLDFILNSIANYAKSWSNPDYFDDFFETLIQSLFISGKWATFYDLYTSLDGYASNEIVAQLAYIYGRLVQEGLVTFEMTGRDSELDARTAFQRALKADSKTYYKILAATKLGLPANQFEKEMQETSYIKTQTSNIPAQNTDEQNLAAEHILTGCVLFGFPDMIYPLWQNISSKGVSTDTAFYISDFLQKCSTGQDDYFQQSLRIASRAASMASRPLKKEELLLVYPQNYLNFVDTSCKKYDIKKSVVFSLIRSESFFDPDVISSAGAIGLTQLMELTSGDIARRLKYKEYSLEDPETNIDFGTYYLSELIRRCDGSYLQAFFAYNAGITRVRRWLQSSLVEFGKKKDMPLDLFLETLPYSETREYGRKLISAGVMYEWLYDQNMQPYEEIVNTYVK